MDSAGPFSAVCLWYFMFGGNHLLDLLCQLVPDCAHREIPFISILVGCVDQEIKWRLELSI